MMMTLSFPQREQAPNTRYDQPLICGDPGSKDRCDSESYDVHELGCSPNANTSKPESSRYAMAGQGLQQEWFDSHSEQRFGVNTGPATVVP